jgi:hypothetical protein
MAGEVPSSLAADRLVDGAPHGVVGLGRRQDALGAREQHARLEAGVLRIGLGLDQAQFLQVRHHRRHAVVAQAARMEARRHEGRAQRVHLDQRRHVRGVAEIVGVFAARQARAGRGLRRDADLPAAAQLLRR